MATPKPKPTPKKETYWEKEERTRNPKDWRNAGFSAAEKKAMAAQKLAEAKKRSKKSKFMIPASPTN